VNNTEKANLSFQRKAVEEFHSCQAAIEAQSHTDKNPLHSHTLSSSVTEKGSHSNTMAAIENVEISSGDDMDDANEQPIRCMSIEFFCHFPISEALTFVVAKKTLVRSNTALSLQTKCTALVVINEDIDNEDI
jgi:hypothetical protein